MKKLKEKGITLVALVVTIIILLILAGVTIAQISGNNGLFSRVRQAVEKYKDAYIGEEQQILQIEKFVSEFSTTEQEGVAVKITKLEVTAGTDNIQVLVEVEGDPVKIEYSIDNGKTYKTKEGDEASREYTYEGLKPGGYFVKVRVYDAEGKYQEGTSDIVTVTPVTTAEEKDVLKDKTFLTGEGIIKTGSMKKHETIEETIEPGGKYTLEEGYYEGGTVTAIEQKIRKVTKTDSFGYAYHASGKIPRELNFSDVEGYQNFTIDDFIIGYESADCDAGTNAWLNFSNPKATYDQTTGILTVNLNYAIANYGSGSKCAWYLFATVVY